MTAGGTAVLGRTGVRIVAAAHDAGIDAVGFALTPPASTTVTPPHTKGTTTP